MITQENVRAKVRELFDEYLSFLVRVVEAESPTNDKEGVDKCASLFIEKAKEYGFKIEKEAQEKSGDCVCITMNGDAAGAPIALSGHLDTVHPVGLFGSPAVRIEDGCIYGPGVCDCKGGAAAGLYAMAVLHHLGYRDRPVKLILQTDEEVSSVYSDLATVRFMCEKSKDCAAFLNLEPHSAGSAVLLRKGIGRYKLTVHGRSTHSSRKWDGASAVLEAAHKIIEIEKVCDKDGITFNCGIVSGGTAANTVPDECEITVDMRFSDSVQLSEGEAFLRKVTENCTVEGTSAELVKVSRRIAMEPSGKNDELLAKLNAVYAETGMPILTKRKSTGGSDAAYITAYGTPCVDNLGIEGGYIHSPKEYARVDSLWESALRLIFPILYL